MEAIALASDKEVLIIRLKAIFNGQLDNRLKVKLLEQAVDHYLAAQQQT